MNSGGTENPGGPLGFYGVLTDKNKKAIRILTAESLVDRSVKVEFECWAYDKEKRNYFKTFHSKDVEIEGELVLASGGQGSVDIWVEETEIPDVQQPALYQFGFSSLDACDEEAGATLRSRYWREDGTCIRCSSEDLIHSFESQSDVGVPI